MTEEPKYYSISEVSHILEQTVYWLRWKEKKLIAEGKFVRPDGSPLDIARSLSSAGKVTVASRRRYTIQDIEDMAKLFIAGGVYKIHPEFTANRILKRIALYRSIGEEGE